jgi:hypothetical protein
MVVIDEIGIISEQRDNCCYGTTRNGPEAAVKKQDMWVK